MKKIVGAIVILGFIGVAFFIVERINRFNLADSTPKTEQELQDIADTKYYREVGDSFEINSVQFAVKDFTILNERDSITLLIEVSLQHTLTKDSSFQSSFFVLKDEAHRIFLPSPGSIDVNGTLNTISLHYSLPEMSLGYFLYRLHLNSAEKSDQKSIVPLYKNYRSEG